MIFPFKYCIIDFETRVSPDKTSEEHPVYRTAPYCLAYKFKGCPVKVLLDEKLITAFFKSSFKLKDFYFVAHNAQYEMFLIRKLLGKSWDKSYGLRFISTDILSLIGGGPTSLHNCGDFWGLKNLKDPYGEELIDVLCFPYNDKTPKKIDGKLTKDLPRNKENFITDKKLLNDLVEYCKKDILCTEELFLKLWTDDYWDMKIHIDYYLNFLRNFKGVPIDMELCQDLIEKLIIKKKDFSLKAKKLAENEYFNINSSKQLCKFLGLDSIKKQSLVQNMSSLDDKQKEMAMLRLNSPKMLEKKLIKAYKPFCFDNFQLYGSSLTRRFTSYGVNFLNFPRKSTPATLGEFYEGKTESYEDLKSLSRQIIKTPYVFFGGDFSQIEFRLLMLVSGHLDILEKLFSGWDGYTYLAQQIYNKKEITPEERYIAKRATLAYGYGLGTKRFLAEMAGEGIFLSYELGKSIKEIYHRNYYNVRKFWDKCELSFIKRRKIKIPYSERILNFFYVKKEANKWYFKTQKRGYVKTWGGHLTGLVIQGLAADVFHFKIRQLAKYGFLVMLPVHDEVVCEIPLTDEKETQKEFLKFKKIMQIKPYFLPAENFPCLQGEFWKADRYIK